MSKELAMHDEMPFGKYSNKDVDIDWILDNNPQYIEWALNETALEFDEEVLNTLSKKL